MSSAQNHYVLERLSIDRRPVGFQRALVTIESPGKESRWWIAVFDAEAGDLAAIGHEVEVRARSREGTHLAGRALTDCITPACHFVGLRGSGPLRIG